MRFFRQVAPFLGFTLLPQLPSTAQAILSNRPFQHVEADTWLRIQYENDVFHHTDYYCTQSWLLELGLQKLERTPLSAFLIRPKASTMRYGVSLEGDAYTPTSITIDSVQSGDRPYAATILATAFGVAKFQKGRARLYSAATIGVIGPAALGYETQAGIHRAIGDEIPQGWHNQIRGNLLINYEVSYERLLLFYSGVYNVSAGSRLRAGTMNTKGGIYASLTVGRIPAAFSSEYEHPINLYGYATGGIDGIAHDATLQGGLLRRREVYRIPGEDMERIVGWWQAGIVFGYRRITAEYLTRFLSPEFRGGRSHRIGGIRVSIAL